MAAESAATGVMNSLLGKLSTLLTNEYNLLKGVRKEVEFLERELGSMNALLQTLADMEKLDAQTKDWRDKVRELSYDIEDCIDLFMHRLGRGDANAGFIWRTARRLKKLWVRHDIANQIRELKTRVEEESKRRERYKLDNCISKPSIVGIDPRLPALYADAKGLVAIDGPRDHIIGWLMDEMVELKVVSIVGCGGLGKTTLAMEVYRKIEGNFRYRASVSVSRTLDLNKLLKDILCQFDQDEYRKCQSEMWEKEQLIRKLRHILTGKRYVVFIPSFVHVTSINS